MGCLPNAVGATLHLAAFQHKCGELTQLLEVFCLIRIPRTKKFRHLEAPMTNRRRFIPSQNDTIAEHNEAELVQNYLKRSEICRMADAVQLRITPEPTFVAPDGIVATPTAARSGVPTIEKIDD
jgi:hypothetical protein